MTTSHIFFDGIVSGDSAIVKLGLADGRNARDKEGNTPLLVAVKSHKDEIIKILVDYGCDINQTIKGWSPLFMAVYLGYESIVKLLVELGANVFQTIHINNEFFSFLGNALTYATEKCNMEMISALSVSLFNIHFSEEQATEIFADIKYGNTEKIKALEKLEDIKKIRDKNGWSPLMVAAANNRDDILSFLIDNGFEVNEIELGSTALFEAVKNNHLTSVSLLLSLHADVDLSISSHNYCGTAIFWAVQYGVSEIAIKLIEASRDINKTRMGDNATALFIASSLGHFDIVHFLLQRGANPNIATVDGTIPISVACKNGHVKVVEQLQDSSWINQCNLAGSTPLHFACKVGNIDIVMNLLSRGAAVNQAETAAEKRVPLHYAVEGGHYEVVKLLLEHYADKERKDKNGETPLQLALRKERHNIVQNLFSKNRIVSEDILNNLLDSAKLANTINRENSELIKRSMGLMQAIARTQCPTCIAILPGQYKREFSLDLLKEIVYDKFDLHILCEADNEAHFTGESYAIDKAENWVTQIQPYIKIGLTLVQISSIGLGAVNIVPPIKEYLKEIGLGNATNILNTVYGTVKLTLNIKSDFSVSSADDAVKSLENASRELTESDKKALYNFIANKSPELRQRGVVLADGTVTCKYLCKRHYAQYDQTGSRIPEAPSYPCRVGYLKILYIQLNGVNSSKARVELKLLSSDLEIPSIKSENKVLRWNKPGQLKVNRVNWLLDLKGEVRGNKLQGLLGSFSFNMYDLVEEVLLCPDSLVKEYTLKTKREFSGRIIFSFSFVSQQLV